MHHPYLVCMLFGMPSLHLFTFLMFLFSCFYTFLISVTATPNSKKGILLSFLHMKTDNCAQATADHPSITKAVGRLFLSIAISSQLNAAPYLRHKPCQLLAHVLREETSLAGETLTCAERVWSISHHHLVSNTPRISWLVNWVSDEWRRAVAFLEAV